MSTPEQPIKKNLGSVRDTSFAYFTKAKHNFFVASSIVNFCWLWLKSVHFIQSFSTNQVSKETHENLITSL